MTADRQNTVACIIPTYNRHDMVVRAVESVLAQTCPVHELIVVDDGSDEPIAPSLARFGDRVTCLRQENAGQSIARNYAASRCSSRWLAFLDSDDAWHPKKVERQLAVCLETQADVCFHDMVFHRLETDEVIPSWNAELARRRGYPPTPTGSITTPFDTIARGGDLLFPSAMMISRDLFESIGRFTSDRGACEDIDLYLRLAQHQAAFAFVDEPLMVRGWASNWETAGVYHSRIKLFRQACNDLHRMGRRADAQIVGAGWLREQRCLAGMYRSRGQRLAACRAYVQYGLASVRCKTLRG